LEKNHLQVVNKQTALSGSQFHTSGFAGGQVIPIIACSVVNIGLRPEMFPDM